MLYRPYLKGHEWENDETFIKYNVEMLRVGVNRPILNSLLQLYQVRE
jgi:hypothetical protein